MSRKKLTFPKCSRALIAGEVRAVEGSEYRREVSFSSETPVRRWFGNEILDHGPDAEISLARLTTVGAVLFNHNPNQIVAKIVSARIDTAKRRGVATIEFVESDPESMECLGKVDSGMLRGISVGYAVHRWTEDDETDDVRVNKWEAYEISLTAVPADASVGVGRSIEQAPSSARGSVRANPRQETTAMFKLKNGREVSLAELDALRMQGDVELADGTTATRSIPASVLDYARQQVGAAPATEPAKPAARVVETPAAEAESDETHKRALADKEKCDPAEAIRRHQIRQHVEFARGACKDAIPDGEAEKLILEGVTADNARTHLVALVNDKRASVTGAANDDNTVVGRPSVITVGADKARESFRVAATHAILQRAGVPIEKLVKPHERTDEFRNASLRDILDYSLEYSGHDKACRGASKEMKVRTAMANRGGAGFAFQGKEDLSIRSGYAHTSSDFPYILANVANLALQVGYSLANVTYNSGWARIVSIDDFKARSVVALSEAPSLSLIGENGEYQHKRLSEKREQYSLATYGEIISITRQAIINDSVDAFTRIPMMIGAAARRTINRTLYDILKTNAALSDTVALFHSTHANVGTAGAPSVTTIAELKKLMRMQSGMAAAADNGAASLLNIEPAFILFGPSQEETILQILHNSIIATQSDKTVSSWVSSLKPVCEPELENTPDACTGDYFLSAAPTMIDTVELGLLNGVDAPFMEEKVGFDVDGMEFKVRVDVGAKAIDYRGLAVNRAS